MQEPEYIRDQVDRLMEAQPAISNYVMSQASQLTVEGVVMVLFHASLIHESIARSTGHAPAKVTPMQLAATADSTSTVEALAETEPHLASYIASNTDLGQGQFPDSVAHNLLAHVARALTETESG
jgi:hypothetical protein